jgi:transcription antitermination factor NusG
MATNLARAQHRLKKAKAELAEVRKELARSKRETKNCRLMLDGSRVRVVKGVMKLKAANGTIKKLQAEKEWDRSVTNALLDVTEALTASLRRRQDIASLN